MHIQVKNFHQYCTKPKYIENELKNSYFVIFIWAILNINGMTSIVCIHNENEYKIEFNQNGKHYDLLLIKKMLSFKRIDLIHVNFIRI